jgi:hypothetical protein
VYNSLCVEVTFQAVCHMLVALALMAEREVITRNESCDRAEAVTSQDRLAAIQKPTQYPAMYDLRSDYSVVSIAV